MATFLVLTEEPLQASLQSSEPTQRAQAPLHRSPTTEQKVDSVQALFSQRAALAVIPILTASPCHPLKRNTMNSHAYAEHCGVPTAH